MEWEDDTLSCHSSRIVKSLLTSALHRQLFTELTKFSPHGGFD